MEAADLDKILAEIAEYEIVLVEDPTLPEYGTRYLQQCIAKCRQYMNRVQYYLQTCTSAEIALRRQISMMETDISIKINSMLADDIIVRRQPSIEDRKAVASTMLETENQELAKVKLQFQDLTETIKIVKMKYNDLRSTNSDIRLQRQLVRDDKEIPGGGYTKPHTEQDGSIPGGMPPVANKPKLDPRDLLDPAKRPDDMPEPRDLAHAEQITSFFNNMESKPNRSEPPPKPAPAAEDKAVFNGGVTYDDLLS